MVRQNLLFSNEFFDFRECKFPEILEIVVGTYTAAYEVSGGESGQESHLIYFDYT